MQRPHRNLSLGTLCAPDHLWVAILARSQRRSGARGVRGLAPKLLGDALEIALHHHEHELLERHGWPPAEVRACFGRVADQLVHFGGSPEPLISFDVAFPLV